MVANSLHLQVLLWIVYVTKKKKEELTPLPLTQRPSTVADTAIWVLITEYVLFMLINFCILCLCCLSSEKE